MKWVLLLHGNRDTTGKLEMIKSGDESGPLVEYAARLHAEWMEDREAGLRAGGAQILLVLAEHVRVKPGGELEVEWKDCVVLHDDMLPYTDWCDAHGLSLAGEDGEANFH